MARPSAKPAIIAAALTLVEEQGVSALTLDSAAEAAGVTKRGLLYHFAGKHELVAGLHQELARRMDAALAEAVGKPPHEASLLERTKAYVNVELHTPAIGEMRLLMEAVNHPEWMHPWLEVYARWFPEENADVENMDELALKCLVARMAADGAWGYEAMASAGLSPEARARLSGLIIGNLTA